MNNAINAVLTRNDLDLRAWREIERRRTVTADGCWELDFTLTPSGYCKINSLATQPYAHRAAYHHWIGPIPEDMQTDHLCRNRACCNPDHLELVTAAENSRRGTLARMRGADVNGRPSRKGALGCVFQDKRGYWIAQVKYTEGGKTRQKRRASKDRAIAEQKLVELQQWKVAFYSGTHEG